MKMFLTAFNIEKYFKAEGWTSGTVTWHERIIKTLTEGYTEENDTRENLGSYINQLINDVNYSSYGEMKWETQKQSIRRTVANQSMDWETKKKNAANILPLLQCAITMVTMGVH